LRRNPCCVNQNRDRAIELYLQFIGERIAEGRYDQFHKGGIDSHLLGEERFIEEVMNKAQIRLDIYPTVSEIVEAVKIISNIDDETLCSRQRGRSVTEARTLIAWAVEEFSNETISEVGRMFGRDVTTLSACIKRMTDKTRSDPGVASRMNLVKLAISNQATKQA
jgi:putative transposase